MEELNRCLTSSGHRKYRHDRPNSEDLGCGVHCKDRIRIKILELSLWKYL